MKGMAEMIRGYGSWCILNEDTQELLATGYSTKKEAKERLKKLKDELDGKHLWDVLTLYWRVDDANIHDD